MTQNNKTHFRLKVFAINALIIILTSKISAQTISYLLPDIGTPGMNTYIEIIGPHDAFGNFGSDSAIYRNDINSTVQVQCVNPNDTNKIIFGPLIVSWNGRMISTQVFVMPWVRPNSDRWYLLNPEYRIPIKVTINGSNTNSDTFYLVKPQHFINIDKPNMVIGDINSPWVRSRRGAIIVDSMDIKSGPTRFSTRDCDPYTDGNQGLLPVTIICMNNARLGSGNPGDTTLSVNGIGRDGGPGGGGAGSGELCGEHGGDGFTGGGGNDLWKSGCPHNMDDGNGSGYRKSGLNGVPGGKFSDANEGGGGGTGHPFGESGNAEPPYTKLTISSYGGGTGGIQDFTPNFCGGGGGGFGTAGGDGATKSGGKIVGNVVCVPFSGGSGGGGGNTCIGEIGGSTGGGGGGGISLYASKIINNIASVSANGSDGNTSLGKEGSGGGGSGGAIHLASKLHSVVSTIYLCGGKGQKVNQQGNTGGTGGDGRLRLDGISSDNINCKPTIFHGPATDTISHVAHDFTMAGISGAMFVRLYMRPLHGEWENINTIRTTYTSNGTYSWKQNIKLPCADSVFLFVAIDDLLYDDTAKYTYSPHLVLSQAAANIFYVKSDSIPVVHILTRDTSVCSGQPVHLDATGGAFYSWDPIKNLNNPNIADPIASPKQSTTYILKSYNVQGCFSTDSMNINIKNGDVLPNQKKPYLCKGSAINLKVNGQFDSIRWNTGETGASITVSPQITTSYDYRVVKKDCILFDTVFVRVVERPKAGFSVDTAQGSAGLLVHFANTSSTAPKYIWNFGDSTPSVNDVNPVHFYTRLGRYTVKLIVFDSLGCSDTFLFRYVQISDSFTLFIPDVFSPDNNGTNDFFAVKSTGVETISCTIYNRWGELVYQNTIHDPGLHKTPSWDGTFKGQKVPVGTYIYIINAQAYSGHRIYRKGFVAIVR